MMKPLAVLLTFLAGWSPAFASDPIGKAGTGPGTESVASDTKTPASQRMKITVGRRVFGATLDTNAAATAFKERLPLSLAMHDVNCNEKACDLPADLPTNDTSPRTIRPGDLMIWNSRTVVVFYRNFPTSYRYTRLGRIEDPEGLAEALGAGDVTVKFELQ
jgi:hypothetical protein